MKMSKINSLSVSMIGFGMLGISLSACSGVKSAEAEWKLQRSRAELACIAIGLSPNSSAVSDCAAKMQMRILNSGQ